MVLEGILRFYSPNQTSAALQLTTLNVAVDLSDGSLISVIYT